MWKILGTRDSVAIYVYRLFRANLYIVLYKEISVLFLKAFKNSIGFYCRFVWKGFGIRSFCIMLKEQSFIKLLVHYLFPFLQISYPHQLHLLWISLQWQDAFKKSFLDISPIFYNQRSCRKISLSFCEIFLLSG